MKKTMKMVKGALALAVVALVGTAQAVTEMKFSGQTSWSTQTLSYYNGDGDGNRGVAGWYYGVTITWPGSGTSWGSSQGNAKHVLTRNGKKIFDNYGDKLSNGSGLTGDTFVGAMHHTYWQAWITPEEAYAANGGDFVQTLVLSGKNGYQSKYSGYSVPETTFTITIPTAGLTLEKDGVKWFPAVALIGEKVYGDLNVAIKTWGTVNCVADGAITEAITVAQDSTLVLNKGSHTITGLDNLTIKGGTYDFDPSAYVAKGYKAYQDGNVWRIKLDHQHNWTYATSTSGNVVTLTATCTNPECTINPPTTSATLTLSSGDKDYDGQAITATLAKNDFETQTGITLGAVECTGNATDVGTYKFSVSAEGTGCDFSKSVTISQLDITSSTEIKLSATDLKYTGAEQTVTITSVKVGNLDVTYTEDTDSVCTAKEIGSYTVKITANGNFTGAASRGWTISNVSGAPASAALTKEGMGTFSGTTLNITDTSKLEYDAASSMWYAGITFTFPYSKDEGTAGLYQKVQYTDPSKGEIRIGEVYYTGSEAVAGVDTAAFKLTGTAPESHYRPKTEREYFNYLNTVTWRVKISPAIIQQAIEEQKTAITGSARVGGYIWGDATQGDTDGVQFREFAINIPIDENLKLYDEVGNQIYPALPYVAQVAETKLKYLTLDAALKAATAGQTVNALAACEQAAFNVGANVTLNLGGFGAAGATYEFVDVTDLNMSAKVVSTKAETVTTAVTGFAVQDDNFTYTLYRSHFHLWEFALDGATLTANCTNTTTECDVETTSITLTVTGGSDGVAPTFAIANADNFLASVNKFASIASIGSIVTERLTDDGASKDKWYVGDYRATCDVEIAGEGTLTLTNDFSISKPEGGYTKNGWIAGSRDVRYDSWEESLAAASDGDTIYYRGNDRGYKTHEFSIGAKNLTLDFGGKTLYYDNGTEDMTLKNAGTGTLTLQNVTIQQPKYMYISHQISAVGNIQFGTGVKTTNQATNPDNYLKITASEGTLIVTNGQYECSFAGTYKLRGGEYQSKYGEPTADTANGYIVRTVSGTYDRDIVYHEHHIAYSAEGNVISATCDAQDHEFCGYGTKTATLNAPDKTDDGQPYSLAEIVYSDGFPEQTGVITYWNGDKEIDPPTKFGSYTAKTTIGGATAVKAFEVVHVHLYESAADQSAGTITLTCTTTTDCVYHTNPHVATLTAQNGTYTGAGQDLATTSTNTGDKFPTNVVLTYSCEGKPTNAGDYTATMTVADKSVEKSFSIGKAAMGGISAAMTSPTLNFTGNEQQNSLGSATLGSYNLTSGDYELSGVTAATGSGYSNETYQVTLTAKGDNFEGSKTVEWTIKAPSTEFANDALGRFDYDDYGGNYGEAGARSLTVTDSTKLIFYNGAWFAGLTVQPPMTDGWTIGNSFWVGVENLRAALSTQPGIFYTGAQIQNNEAPGMVLSTKRWGITSYYYVDPVKGLFNITPQMVEDASKDGKESVEFTMTAGGIAWSPDGKTSWDGVRYTDFKLIMPVTNAVFAVRANETADIGDTVLSAAKIRLGVGASVTTTAEQAEGQVYTEETGYQVYMTGSAGTNTYACVARPQVTVEDAAHQATKVVTVGGKEITGEGNVYTVDYNSTVTVAYTFETGYETTEPTKTVENVTAATTITAPAVTAKSYAINYELDGGVNNPANPAKYTIESETITLADPTKQDYDFTGWMPTNVIEVGSTGDKAFTATWKLAVVEFTVAAPANASVTKVATNGVEMVAPYKVLPGTAVTVSYKADAGYLFANGTDAMDAEITVNAAGEQPAPQGTETAEAEAKIGTTYYLTLADALTNAADKATVTVVKDCEVAERINIDPAKSVTLDADGKTVNVAAGVYAFVYGGATETTGAGTLTVTGNGTFYAPTANATCFLWARRGNVVVENGSFSMDGSAQCVYADNGCKATINGGTFVNRTGADVLNVHNTRSVVTDIQCYGGSYSKDPATGDDSLKGSFVAEGYASYKDGEMFTVAKLPAVTVTDITPAPADLEAAFQYATTDTESAFTGGWKVDFFVSFDADVAAGAVTLKGQYGEYPWLGAPLPAMKADEEYQLCKDGLSTEVSVEQLLAIGTFNCGVTNVSAKGGTTIRVVLKMYKGDESFVLHTKEYELIGKGPTIVDPIGGDPETYPEIKPVEDTNGVYYVEVKTNTTTVVEIDGLKEDDTVIVPPQINAVNGTDSNPISSNQVKVVANATNGTETVAVDITPAFTIKEEDNGVLIELNSNAVVTVKIEGKDPEDIAVMPELTESEDPVKPLVIDDAKVATGVKTIPGLKYSLLSGDTVTKIDTLVKTIVAEDTRVVLEAAKTADPSKFYKIQVAK